MQNFGLTEYTIEQIHRILRQYPEVESAVIYGSRAKGNYCEGSDIDLALKGVNLNYDMLLQISSRLEDASTPYLFDLSIYHQLTNPALIEHIDRIGQIFYQNKDF